MVLGPSSETVGARKGVTEHCTVLRWSLSVTKDFEKGSNRESQGRAIFEEVRRIASENLTMKKKWQPTLLFSQIALDWVHSIQRPESSFEKRTPK